MLARNGRSTVRTLSAAVGAILLIGGTTGCSADVSIGDQTLDTGDLQTQIANQMAAKGVDPNKLKVACPDGQKPEKGTTFTCTLTDLSGKTHPVDVTLTDNSGSYTAEVPKGK